MRPRVGLGYGGTAIHKSTLNLVSRYVDGVEAKNANGVGYSPSDGAVYSAVGSRRKQDEDGYIHFKIVYLLKAHVSHFFVLLYSLRNESG